MKTINKKGFLPRDFVVAALLFSGMIALTVLIIAGMAAEYDNTDIVNEDFAETYDQLDLTLQGVGTMQNSSTSNEETGFIGTFDVVFGATFTVIQLVFDSLGLYGDMASSISSDFSFIDSQVIQILFFVGLGIITTLLVFAWISAISRGKL